MLYCGLWEKMSLVGMMGGKETDEGGEKDE